MVWAGQLKDILLCMLMLISLVILSLVLPRAAIMAHVGLVIMLTLLMVLDTLPMVIILMRSLFARRGAGEHAIGSNDVCSIALRRHCH